MTSTDETPAPAGPYAAHALDYHRAGWAPLPLPARAKKSPPDGWTGTRGAWPSWADVHAWTEDHPDGNIALRLPPNVIGVDVDAYGDKPGGLVLHQLETQHGPLPPTWRSTSRDDGTSGIRFYAVPEGLRWPGILGPGIEVIRHGHRYAVAWPSTHPEGGTYRWITPDGATTLTGIPTPDTLPELPHAWVAHFTGGELAADQARAGLSTQAATDWLTRHGDGPACRATTRALDRLLTDLAVAASRHDTALTGTNRIVWMAGLGHTGTTQALATARAAFLAATAGDRAHGEAEAEWDRMIAGAVDLAAAAHPTPPPADPCTDPFAGLIDRSKTCPQPPPPPTPETAPRGTTTPASTHQPSADAPATDTTSQPAVTAESLEATAPTSAADDALLEQIARNQARAQEIERQRAQRDARRVLDEEERDQLLADRVARYHLDDEAKRIFKLESIGAQEPPEGVSLTDLLAQDDDPVRYRVANLWPVGGRVVLAAPAKAGKSTAVMNLVRSLVDHEPYLGTFDIHPPTGRVVVIDNELDPRQIRTNYRKQGITNTDQVEIIPLRGKVATFDILDQHTRAEWAEKLQAMNASVVIFDCLRPLIDALGLSEDKDAGRVLVAFDALLADAGIEEGLVVHHMGHSGERSRGDTRIRDWPDAEWKIVKAPTEEGENDDLAARFFSAFGRDVSVTETVLEHDPDAHRLLLGEGSRAEAKLQPALDTVLDLLAENPGGLSGNKIEQALRDSDHSRNEVRKAYKMAVRKQLATTEDGPDRAIIYRLTDPGSPGSPPVRRERVANRYAGTPFRGPAPANQTGHQGGSARHSANPRLCDDCGTPLDTTRELLGATRCRACSQTPQLTERVIAGRRVLFDPTTRTMYDPDTGEVVD